MPTTSIAVQMLPVQIIMSQVNRLIFEQDLAHCPWTVLLYFWYFFIYNVHLHSYRQENIDITKQNTTTQNASIILAK